METAMWLGIFALAGTLLGAFVTAVSKKWRTPTDDREDKKVVFDAAEKLVERFQKLLNESDEKHGKEIGELANKVQKLQDEVEAMRSERTGLVAALRRAIAFIRRHGGDSADEEIAALGIPDSVSIN